MPSISGLLLLLSHSVRFDSLQPPWTAARQAPLSFTISQNMLRFNRVGDDTQPSHPLSLPSPPALNLSSISVFSNESALHIRWPKSWNFSFSISPFSEYSGLISFRIDWFDLPVVQGTLKSSPAPQFKSTNSLALSLLYGPVLTSVHDYWKNHSFDYMVRERSKT